MEGVGPPLVTPFDESGDVDESRLRELVSWVEDRGVDFLVPCGSNSEAELLTTSERARVIEIVTETADVPVLAGTGNPGLRETTRATERAADATFDLLVGSGSLLAQALNAGATGGVLALANVAPEHAATVYEIARDDPAAARERGAALVESNHAITAEYGIPGLKYAMRERGAPAGYARSPHRAPDESARDRIDELLDRLPDV